MQGKMSRYRNYIMGIVLALVVLFTGVCSNSFESKAASHEFSLDAARPSISSTQGYIECLLYNSNTGRYFPYIYVWNAFAVSSESMSEYPVEMAIEIGDNSIYFGANSYESANVAYTVMNIDSNSAYRLVADKQNTGHRITWSSNITCHGYHIYGNGFIRSDSISSGSDFVVHWSTDESAELLGEIFNLLISMKDGSSLALIENKVNLLYQRLNVTNVRLQSVLGSLENFRSDFHDRLDMLDLKISDILDEVRLIDDTLNDILEEEKKQTSWLEKIWNSLQEFFGTSDDEKQKGEDFKENSQSQNDELGDLITESEVEKPDVDDIMDDIDSNVDLNSINTFGDFLAVIWENEYVTNCLLMVGVMLIMGYVLFGKKG